MVVQTEAKRKEAGIEQVTQGCSHCHGFGFYSERSEDPLGGGRLSKGILHLTSISKDHSGCSFENKTGDRRGCRGTDREPRVIMQVRVEDAF